MEQLRIALGEKQTMKTKLKYTQQFALVPWSIQAKGYNGHYDITIYHPGIVTDMGYARYRNIELKSAKAFADFIYSQLKVWQIFSHNTLEIHAIDYIALHDAYKKGQFN